MKKTSFHLIALLALTLILGTVTSAFACTGGSTTDRYTDCGDGTIRDNNTGLLWLKDASCTFFGEQSFANANDNVALLEDGDCGLTDGSSAGDWYLPTANEFCSAWANNTLTPCPASTAAPYSLIDASVGPPTVTDTAGTGTWTPNDPFTNVKSDRYWTANDRNDNTAWFVHLGNGNISNTYETEVNWVWPVRSPNRYTDLGNGTIRDNETGLFWLKDASCVDLAKDTFNGAQTAVAGLSNGDCGLTDGSSAGDWRVPTAAEFCSSWAGSTLTPCPASSAADSLVDSSVGPPTVSNSTGNGGWTPLDPFMDVKSGIYWTSNQHGVMSGWFVNLSNGNVSTTLMSDNNWVWAVRDAL